MGQHCRFCETCCSGGEERGSHVGLVDFQAGYRRDPDVKCEEGKEIWGIEEDDAYSVWEFLRC